ncbi:ATP synthase subunit I [Candidatus Chloroploca sp. Khr17]|uniref:ATP synthase subunit I n=1 Tax=Candidatus Chloroploca sp. Khr17 TaxID=2496869 RepID=UPI00196B5EBE|nr:ATP synthase subunit I [Candidatus Chloroploca sp. Khr17]
MMNEQVILVLALVTGMLLGAIFFGGLWWTAQQLVSSRQPARWFFGSLVLRTSIVLVGFYVISHGHWERMLACMLGFVIARLMVFRLTRAAETPAHVDHEANHAS